MFVHETLSIRINAGRRAIPPCHLPPLVNRVPVFLRIRFAASSFLFRCPRPLSRNSTAARPSSVCACPPARYSSFDRYSLLFAQDQDRPSVRPSFRSPSVSREASFSAPTKAHKKREGIEGGGGDISAFCERRRRREVV